MKKFAIFLVYLISASLCADEVSTPSENSVSISDYEKLLVATQIYSAVQISFAHWDGTSINFNDSFDVYLKKISSIHGRRDFDLATSELVSSLKNSHTYFYDSWLWGPSNSLPFKLQKFDGKWVVVKSVIADLKLGDIVTKIDNKPAEEYILDARRFVSGSNDRAATDRLFTYGFLFPEKFSIVNGMNKIINIDQKVASPQETIKGDPSWSLLERSIGLITIPSFANQKFIQAAAEIVRKNAPSARALVIDVRKNGGGSTPVELISLLISEPAFGLKFSYSQTTSISSVNKQRPAKPSMVFTERNPILPADQSYRKPIYILIGRECGSACEDFVAYMKDQFHVTTIGEATYGSTGQPQAIKINSDFMIIVGSKREYFADGSAFEGVGIKPKIEVPVSIRDLQTNNDPVLKKALLLAEKI